MTSVAMILYIMYTYILHSRISNLAKKVKQLNNILLMTTCNNEICFEGLLLLPPWYLYH